MLEIARCQGYIDLLGGGYRKVGDADSGVTAAPAGAELAGSPRHCFGYGNPVEQRK